MALFVDVRLRVLRMSTRLVGVILLSMRFALSGCGVVRVMMRLMTHCRYGRPVLFLLVMVRIRCVMRSMGAVAGTRMRMRMMVGRFRSGVLLTVTVVRVSVRVDGAMTVSFIGRIRSTGRVRVRVRVRVVRVAALMMTVFGVGGAVLVTLPLRLIVMQRCMRLLVPMRARVPVLVPLLLLRLAVMRSPLLLLGGSFRLCLLLLRLTSFPLSRQVVQSLLVFRMVSIVCVVVVVGVMRFLVLRVSVPVLLFLVSVPVLLLLVSVSVLLLLVTVLMFLLLLLMSVLRLLVCGVCGAFGFVALLDYFLTPKMCLVSFSSLVNLALALQPGALVLSPLPLTLRRPVLRLLLGLALFLLGLALLLLFRGVVIVLMATMMMSATMSGSQHHQDVVRFSGRRRGRSGGLDARRHRRRLYRGTLAGKKWRGVERIGRRGGARDHGEIRSPKWICAVERQLGAVDKRPLLIHLSCIPPLMVQALVLGLSHIVQADKSSRVREIATEVVDHEEGESENAQEREGQGADGSDCEGPI
jgi:hypothetical protein